MKQIPGLSGLSVALQRDERGTQLVITGTAAVRSFLRTKEERFRVELSVDVISTDGKLYYVPRTFFAFGPAGVDENTVVQDGVKPSADYVRLDSGVYVPVDYVSDTTMKRLKELNGEYLTLALMSKLQCEEKCDNFDDFVNVYRKKFTMVAEQVRLLAADLRSKGFRFNAKGDNTVLVEVVGPDGDAGYYIADRSSRYQTEVNAGMHKGKWALLAETYSIPIISRYMNVEWDFRKRGTAADQDDVMECVAELKQDGNIAVFVCDKGKKVVVPRPPKDADGVHKYRVIYKKAQHGVNIALSFTQIHNAEVKRDVTEIVTRKGLIQFGRVTRTCTLTNHTVDEFLIDDVHDMDVISVDNKTLIVQRDECSDMRSAKIVDQGIKPSVRYTELPGGLYAPTDYVSKDFISNIQGLDKESQADAIVSELMKNGFKFSRNYKASIKTEISVVGPDGDEGYYRLDSFFMLDCYKGKWSLLGPAFYYSKLSKFFSVT